MKQRQAAYDCINCATDICPNNDDPAVIIAKYLSPPPSEGEIPVDKNLNSRVMMLCKDCTEYLKYKTK